MFTTNSRQCNSAFLAEWTILFLDNTRQKQKRNVFQLRNICLHTRRIMEFEISDEFSKL